MLEKLNQFIGMIPQGNEKLTVIAIIAWDVVRRLWKTAKPASFLHDMAAIMKMLSSGLYNLGQFIDTLAPQNVVDQEKGELPPQ